MVDVLQKIPTPRNSVGGVLTLEFIQSLGSLTFTELIETTSLTEDTTLAFSTPASGSRFILTISNTNGVDLDFTFPAGVGQGSLTSLTTSIPDGTTWEATGILIGTTWRFTLEQQTTLT